MWDTASIFSKARTRLTANYLVVLACILAIFSALLFEYTTHNFRARLDAPDLPEYHRNHIVDETIDDLLQSIIIADLVALVIAGGFSFWLAGKTLKPIQTALDAQEKFSGNASHELRTPLAVLRSDFEVFAKDKHKTIRGAEDLAERGLVEVNRMTDMVENLLILARSKDNTHTLHFEEVDIANIVKLVTTKMQPLAKTKMLELQLNIEDSASIKGNPKLLEQLFTNIIQNALTYTEHGRIDVTVKADEQVSVIVKDTGVGIDAKQISEIFKPFYTADTSRSVTNSGVGLGLSIVREIMDKHRGNIVFHSELDKGTSVKITFPLS